MAEFEARAAFLLRLRENGIRDLGVLRALEAVPRAAFLQPDHVALAYRDIILPTACGQSVPDPLFVARLAAGSRLTPNMRVLLIGLGSGYTAAVLSRLVANVVAVDRFRTLVAEASTRFAALGGRNIEPRWADGLDLPEQAPFDRVVIVATLAPVPPSVWRLVKSGGGVVHARPSDDRPGSPQMLMMVERPDQGISRQTIIAPARLGALRPGLAAHL